MRGRRRSLFGTHTTTTSRSRALIVAAFVCAMDHVRHTLHSALKNAAEAVLPVRSAAGGFRTSGVLTPSEFVAAGDFLVATCPTWAWEVWRCTEPATAPWS